jgi:hypothetical protein
MVENPVLDRRSRESGNPVTLKVVESNGAGFPLSRE